jgi:hypothetical protein
MADVKTVLEAMTLEELEGVKKVPKEKVVKELTEQQIVELNTKLRRPVAHGGLLGLAREYKKSMAVIKAIAEIRNDVISAKRAKKVEEPIEEPIK